MPYKIKNRAGRHVEGQGSYDPILDLKNWSKESIDAQKKCLTPFALQTALQHSSRKPQYLTRFGRDRLIPVEEQLFPEIGLHTHASSTTAPGASTHLHNRSMAETLTAANQSQDSWAGLKEQFQSPVTKTAQWVSRTKHIGDELAPSSIKKLQSQKYKVTKVE